MGFQKDKMAARHFQKRFKISKITENFSKNWDWKKVTKNILFGEVLIILTKKAVVGKTAYYKLYILKHNGRQYDNEKNSFRKMYMHVYILYCRLLYIVSFLIIHPIRVLLYVPSHFWVLKLLLLPHSHRFSFVCIG